MMTAKIVGIQSGEVLDHNKAGELWLKGPPLAPVVPPGSPTRSPRAAAGAAGHDLAQAAGGPGDWAGEWFRTGDVAYCDASGAFHVLGAVRDLIVTTGGQVAPGDIEEVLLGHAAVSDAAVVPRGWACIATRLRGRRRGGGARADAAAAPDAVVGELMAAAARARRRAKAAQGLHSVRVVPARPTRPATATAVARCRCRGQHQGVCSTAPCARPRADLRRWRR